MKMPLSFRTRALGISILAVFFSMVGHGVILAQGEEVSQVTFYVH
jgi:hypothetical protein